MSYYQNLVEEMTSYYTKLAKCTPDQASDVMIRIQVLASQLDLYCRQADEAVKQAFADTATGEALERHAALRGLTRKEGAKAIGTVAFCRSSPAGYDILIPAGTIVQSAGETPLQYVTTMDYTLLGTRTRLSCNVEAVEPGAQYNLKGGSITVMVTPPPGISRLEHSLACTGGTDPETDDELRARLFDCWRAPAVGLSPGYYKALAASQSSVGKVKVLPICRGSGTVDLVVYGKNKPLTSGQLSDLQALFQEQRDLGIDVLVRAAQTSPVNLEAEVAPMQGWDAAALADSCRTALSQAIDGLDIGSPWLLAKMNSVIMAQPGVYNCRIFLPTADTFPLEDRLLTPGSIAVTPMEVTV